jgi:hypothetical protein
MRHLVPEAALLLIRSLDASWRYRETDRHHLEAALAGERPVIGSFLHGRIFLLLRFMGRPRNGRWLSMCSQSLDGDAMAKLEERLGFEVVRGSSGRGGLQAIVDMIERVNDTPGLGACLAIDGSRGPRGRAQGGIIALAQRTGGTILPVTASARPAYIFKKAWDRTLLPLPFARVDLVYGEPFTVPARLKAAELEHWRAELERRMVALQERANEQAGFGDDAPIRAPLPDAG